MIDFTLTMYRYLCGQLLSQGFTCFAMSQYFDDAQGQRLFLRHDVDRQPQTALEMAKIEKGIGIQSTYFFRVKSDGEITEVIIKQIAALGMEIGYHYECLDQAGGDMKRAMEIFERNLERLRKIYPVVSIAMHGNPLSRYDNKTLWDGSDFRKYGITVDAYLSLDFEKTYYFSDTGRNWNSREGKVYDKIEGREFSGIDGTKDLPEFIKKLNCDDICILTHPNRWSNNPVLWSYNFGYDLLGSTVKRLIKRKR